MKLLNKILYWGDHHHSKWLDLFRIALGFVLIWKGILFALNLNAFTALMMQHHLSTAVALSMVAHLIIGLHIIGGFFILIGSQTRLFCLVNIPILLVAVLFVNLSQNIFSPYAEFWLSCSVLAALIFFLVEGDGVWSVEHHEEMAA